MPTWIQMIIHKPNGQYLLLYLALHFLLPMYLFYYVCWKVFKGLYFNRYIHSYRYKNLNNQLFISDIHWSISIFTMGLLGFTITCCFVKFSGSLGSLCFPESGMDRFYLFLAGVFNFLAHVLKVFICKFENAAFGALLTRSIDVMITFLGQYLFFNVNTKFNFKIHYILIRWNKNMYFH